MHVTVGHHLRNRGNVHEVHGKHPDGFTEVDALSLHQEQDDADGDAEEEAITAPLIWKTLKGCVQN